MCQQSMEFQAAAMTQQVGTLLCNPRISGWVVTQLNDVSWEFQAGILDLWRKPKAAYEALCRMNQPHLLVMKAEKNSIPAGGLVKIELTLVNRQPLPGNTQLVVLAGAGTDQATIAQRPVPVSAGIHPLESVEVRAQSAGTVKITACLAQDGGTISETSETLPVLYPVDWSSLPALRCLGKAPEIPGFVQPEKPAEAAEEAAVVLAAYPASLNDEDWAALFEMVEAGGTAVMGALKPKDSTALQALKQRKIPVELHPGVGSWHGHFHWLTSTEIFEGLPKGGMAMKPYVEALPKYVLSEMGGEVHAGSLRATITRVDGSDFLWYSGIEAVPYGKGRIIFCQYRAFEKLLSDPLAARLVENLLRYAAKK
jgi:hypothetical protein